MVTKVKRPTIFPFLENLRFLEKFGLLQGSLNSKYTRGNSKFFCEISFFFTTPNGDAYVYRKSWVGKYDPQGYIKSFLVDPLKNIESRDGCYLWDEIHLAYFIGCTLGNTFSEPVLFLKRGFKVVAEGDPGYLRVSYPRRLATHSIQQTLVLDEKGLIGRKDRSVLLAGKAPSSVFLSDYRELGGVMTPHEVSAKIRSSDSHLFDQTNLFTLKFANLFFL